MALLPSLTTSNSVVGSPPSPLCCAMPFGLLPPLSTGDLRAFLLAACWKSTHIAVFHTPVVIHLYSVLTDWINWGMTENRAKYWWFNIYHHHHPSLWFHRMGRHTGGLPGRPLFFFPFPSPGSSSSLTLRLRLTVSPCPDSLDESLHKISTHSLKFHYQQHLGRVSCQMLLQFKY